jgi:phosphoglycolate phosphatase-like HAD superfamily hydrolase
MAEDLDGWLAPNRIYAGVAEVIRALMASQETYIVTTKQARFTKTILARMADIHFPPERIFSQTVSGRPKSEVLESLNEKHPGSECHFVEDKLSTLEKVSSLPHMEHWNLYLVDWGYNTVAERERAKRNERIRVITVEEFQQLAGLG